MTGCPMPGERTLYPLPRSLSRSRRVQVMIRNPVAGDYVIGVYAFTTTQYTLVATVAEGVALMLDGHTTRLQPSSLRLAGVPIRATLGTNQYAYFQLICDNTTAVSPCSFSRQLGFIR